MKIWILTTVVSTAISKKCYVCTGVGAQSSKTAFSFFDLSSFEEAKTIEVDESTQESQLCNDLSADLPETMLETCPNQSDVCYIETVTGQVEGAMELEADIFSPNLIDVETKEEIVEMKSTQISRGCLNKDSVPANAATIIEAPEFVKEGDEYKYEKQKWCSEMNDLGLVGEKCVTACVFEGCNSAGRLSILMSFFVILVLVF